MIKPVPGVKVYDEHTGNPAIDNLHRNMNRSLHRTCRDAFRVVTPRGRKRKKQIIRIEYPRYLRLVAAVAEDIQSKHHREGARA